MGLIRKAIQAGLEAAAGDSKPSATAQQPATNKPTGNDAPAAANAQRSAPSTTSAPAPPPHPGKNMGLLGKPLLAFKMITNKDIRYSYSLSAASSWGISMVIVGIILLILTLTGDYPTTVANQKEEGIYIINIVKYSLYIGAGILGIIACTTARRALRAHKSVIIQIIILYLCMLMSLTTIALTIYSAVQTSDYNAWWSYLIQIFFILQRLFFIAALSSATRSLRDAEKDAAVAEVVCGSALQLPSHSDDEEKGRNFKEER